MPSRTALMSETGRYASIKNTMPLLSILLTALKFKKCDHSVFLNGNLQECSPTLQSYSGIYRDFARTKD